LRAGVAQLVEHQLPKLRVAGSRPVSRLLNFSVNEFFANADVSTKPGQLRMSIRGRTRVIGCSSAKMAFPVLIVERTMDYRRRSPN
jgi:hypothetical protein